MNDVKTRTIEIPEETYWHAVAVASVLGGEATAESVIDDSIREGLREVEYIDSQVFDWLEGEVGIAQWDKQNALLASVDFPRFVEEMGGAYRAIVEAQDADEDVADAPDLD